MRRYKKREVAECQTVIQCTPFILSEGEYAIVVSNQNTQTVATCEPNDDDFDFYPQLMRIDPEIIRQDFLQVFKNTDSTQQTFELPLEDITLQAQDNGENEQIGSISNPSDKLSLIVRNPSIQVDEREGFDEKMSQTRLMVFPHFLRDNEFAIISTDICTQTSVSCEPETSLTDIIPKLKSFLEHDSHEAEETGDTVANRSILDIILEIIKDVEDSHKQWFGNNFLTDVPSELINLQNACAICQDPSLPLDDQARKEMCEAPCHQQPPPELEEKVVTEKASKAIQVEEEIQVPVEELPVEEEIYLEPVEEISEIDEPSEEEELITENTSVEEETSFEQDNKSADEEVLSIVPENVVDEEEPNESEVTDSGKNKCRNCVCSNLKIRLYINNLGLPEDFPSKNICLELNVLREMQNIQITAIDDEYEEDIEEVVCDPTCCITESHNILTKDQKNIVLPDGRKTACPVIISKLNKDGYKYFCQEDEADEGSITIEEELEYEISETEAIEYDVALRETDEPEVEESTEPNPEEPVADSTERIESEIAEIDPDAESLKLDTEGESEANEPEAGVIESQKEVTESEGEVTESEGEATEAEVILTETESTATEIEDESQKQDTNEAQPSEVDSSELVYCIECAEALGEDGIIEQVDDKPTEPTEEQEGETQPQDLSLNEAQPLALDSSEQIEPTEAGVLSPESTTSSTKELSGLPPCHCDNNTADELDPNAEQIEDGPSEDSKGNEPITEETENIESVENIEVIEPTEEENVNEDAQVVDENEPEEVIEETEPKEDIEETEPAGAENETEEGEPVADENVPIEEGRKSEFTEDEQEVKDLVLPFCEKKIIKKKRSSHILESKAMSVNNLLDGKIMALISKFNEGFEVVINIKSTLPKPDDECKCNELSSTSEEQLASNSKIDSQPSLDNNAEGDEICTCGKKTIKQQKSANHPCKCNPNAPTSVCNCDKIPGKNSCCPPLQLDISDDEYETCSEGPSTSRSKKSPEIMQPIPEVRSKSNVPSTSAQLVLPDNTVLNLVLSLDMKNYDQICVCSKKRDKLHRHSSKGSRLHSKTSHMSKHKFSNKGREMIDLQNMSASPSFLQDVNSIMFTDSSKTINILTPTVSQTTYLSERSIANTGVFRMQDKTEKYQKRLDRKLSFRRTIEYDTDNFASLTPNQIQTNNSDKGENYCTRDTCEHLTKKQSCTCSKSKKMKKESDTPCEEESEENKITENSCDEKQDAVYMAFKACEVELKPVITALTNIRQELKSLNMPEIDSIFNKSDVYPDIPSSTAFQKKISELNTADNISCKVNLKIPPTIIQISQDKNQMKTTTKLKFNYIDCDSLPVPEIIPQQSKSSKVEYNKDTKYHRPDCKYNKSQPSTNEERKSSTGKVKFSLLPDSNTTQNSFYSTAYKYQNSNFTEDTNSLLTPLKLNGNNSAGCTLDLPFYNSQDSIPITNSSRVNINPNSVSNQTNTTISSLKNSFRSSNNTYTSKSSNNIYGNCDLNTCKSRSDDGSFSKNDFKASNTNSIKNYQSVGFKYVNPQFNSATTTSATKNSSINFSRTGLPKSQSNFNMYDSKLYSDYSKNCNRPACNFNSTYHNTQYNYNFNLKTDNDKSFKNENKLNSHTNPTYNAANYNFSDVSKKIGRNVSFPTLPTPYSNSEATIKYNDKFNNNYMYESFENQNRASSSKSNLSCVLSEEFICPHAVSSYGSNHGKKKNHSKTCLKSTSLSVCPFLKIMESMIYKDKPQPTNERKSTISNHGCKKCGK